MTYKKMFPCGHMATVNNEMYHKPACPTCFYLAKALVEAGTTDPETVRAMRDFAFSTPTGRPKPIAKTLQHLATLDPESVPKYAALAGENWDWARHLLAGTKPERELTKSARVALAIRKDLAKAYPGVKIRATSSNFSMGDSVNVSGTFKSERDAQQAERLISKYKYGRPSERMDDSWDDSYNRRDDIPQTKFLHINFLPSTPRGW
jgi:hypothetical protein